MYFNVSPLKDLKRSRWGERIIHFNFDHPWSINGKKHK